MGDAKDKMKAIHYQDFGNKLDDIFQTYERKTAIVEYVSEENVRKYSYGELFEYAMKVKLALARLNVLPKERAAVLARPSAQSAMLLLALSYLGYTAVLTDVSLPAEEQNRLIHFTEPSAIITTEELAPSLDEELRTSLPILCFQGEEGLRLWNSEPREWRKSAIPGSEDVIAISFTSDTTGSVKSAEITYQAMAYSAIACAHYAEYGVKTRFLHILPQTHVAGYAMLFINFLQGSEMAFVPEISTAGLAMGLRKYEPTHLFMIPKDYETIQKEMEEEIAKCSAGVRLLFHSCKALSGTVRRLTGIRMKHLMRRFYAPTFGRNIEVIGCGTAPCADETARFFQDLGICFLNVYGSTEESFPICSGNVSREKYKPTAGDRVEELTLRLRDAFLDLRESVCQFSQEEKAGGIVL